MFAEYKLTENNKEWVLSRLKILGKCFTLMAFNCY